MDNNLLKKAYQLHQQGQLAEAEALYLELLQADPKQVDILHGLAALYGQSKKHDQALKTINQAIEVEPHHAALYNSKGNIYLGLNQPDEAIKQYEKAIACDEYYAIAYNNLGKSYYTQDKLDQAKTYYKKAIELVDHYGDAHYNLAILLTKLGDNKPAILHLERCLFLNPQRPMAYGQLAEVCLHEGDYLKAIENYQQRLDLEPEHTASYFALGQAYLEAHQMDDAIAAFKKTLIMQPNHLEANHYLGNAHLGSGDTETAINYYYRQLEAKPMVESYYNIGVLLMRQNRHKESIQYLEHAAKLEPSYLPVHINLGALYLKLNHIPDAIRHYEDALTIQPDDAEIQHILSALSGETTPDKAPTEYLSHLFDQYATYYDKHLTESLEYKAHELLFKAIEEESQINGPEWTILDLGCGTGLCGNLLKRFAKKLIGIDVAEKMVALAKEKDLYDVLEVMDVDTALSDFKDNDLIVAGDVFSYIGKLDGTFRKAHTALNPKGLFAFTVEKTYVEPYELQQSIRYAHSKKYLSTLAESSRFKVLRINNIVLRKQRKVPVEGYLVILTPS
jgi:predicted TPR repeat methyltransferase